MVFFFFSAMSARIKQANQVPCFNQNTIFSSQKDNLVTIGIQISYNSNIDHYQR